MTMYRDIIKDQGLSNQEQKENLLKICKKFEFQENEMEHLWRKQGHQNEREQIQFAQDVTRFQEAVENYQTLEEQINQNNQDISIEKGKEDDKEKEDDISIDKEVKESKDSKVSTEKELKQDKTKEKVEKRQIKPVDELVKMISEKEKFIKKELKLSKGKYNELTKTQINEVLDNLLKRSPYKGGTPKKGKPDKEEQEKEKNWDVESFLVKYYSTNAQTSRQSQLQDLTDIQRSLLPPKLRNIARYWRENNRDRDSNQGHMKWYKEKMDTQTREYFKPTKMDQESIFTDQMIENLLSCLSYEWKNYKDVSFELINMISFKTESRDKIINSLFFLLQQQNIEELKEKAKIDLKKFPQTRFTIFEESALIGAQKKSKLPKVDVKIAFPRNDDTSSSTSSSDSSDDDYALPFGLQLPSQEKEDVDNSQNVEVEKEVKEEFKEAEKQNLKPKDQIKEQEKEQQAIEEEITIGKKRKHPDNEEEIKPKKPKEDFELYPIIEQSEKDKFKREYTVKILYLLSQILKQHKEFSFETYLDLLNNDKKEKIYLPSIEQILLDTETKIDNVSSIDILFSVLDLPCIQDNKSGFQQNVIEVLSCMIKGLNESKDYQSPFQYQLSPKNMQKIIDIITSNQCNLQTPKFLEQFSSVVVFFCLNDKNKKEFVKSIRELLRKSAEVINGKMEKKRHEMRKVYKCIFNVSEIPKENMKNPSPKERKVLEKHEKYFKEEIFDDFPELSTFYTIFQLFWTIYKQEYKNLAFGSTLKTTVKDELLSPILIDVWLNSSEIMSIINDLYPSELRKRYPIVRNLLPLMDSFFIAQTISEQNLEQVKKKKPDQKDKQSEEEYSDTEYDQIQLQRVNTFQLSKDTSKAKEQDASDDSDDIDLPDLVLKESFSTLKLNYNVNMKVIFEVFALKNKAVLNKIIDVVPSLMEGPLKYMMLNRPTVINFVNKEKFLRKQFDKLYGSRSKRREQKINLNLRRDYIIFDSMCMFLYKMKKPFDVVRHNYIHFVKEEGEDDGGLLREWYTLLAGAIFNPNFSLFEYSTDRSKMQPNPQSKLNPFYRQIFKFVGMFIAKAIICKHPLDAYFTKSFYKHMLGLSLKYTDFEEWDAQHFESLQWILNNDYDNVEFPETFSYYENDFHTQQFATKNLIPNGSNIEVTNKNKKDFVKKYTNLKMAKCIEPQLKAFLEGFYYVIPKELLCILQPHEIELLICGLPDFDCNLSKFIIYLQVDDLYNNLNLYGYEKSSPQIKWLFEVLKEYDLERRALFLMFLSGSAKVPIGGFKNLQYGKVKIEKRYGSKDRMPIAHTCYNTIEFPPYDTKEMLKQKLDYALDFAMGVWGDA